MKTEDLLLTVAHQANELRVRQTQLEQMLAHSKEQASKLDRLTKERDEALAKVRDLDVTPEPGSAVVLQAPADPQ